MRIKIWAMMLTAIILLVGCQGMDENSQSSDKAPNNTVTDDAETRNLSTGIMIK